MMYSEQIIEQVQLSCDIVEVISGYIPLKRAGRNFKACCPFHEEKTPSFHVNPDKQFFHCFGCSVGGDVFSFLMKFDHMNFPEAVRHLAAKAGIQLPEKADPSSGPDRSLNERLYLMGSVAAEYYHAQLLHPETGKEARAYLKSRGFELSEIKTFQLGYALPEWRCLLQVLTKRGFREQEMLSSGMISRSSQGSLFDLFRGRIMFPIMNAQGKVIAFGGRVMGKEEPKYLNSPETPIFRKRREMFALNFAKRALSTNAPAGRKMIILEGYMDCIRMHSSGFHNVVATLGTALTPDHVQILKRYVDGAIIMFDGDKAGEQAALRSLDIFLEEGMPIQVLSLPDELDPDDFVRLKGRDAMQELIEKAEDIFDFKLRILLTRYNQADSLGLIKITNEFLETFVKIKNPILLDRYLRRLAMTLGVEERSLRLELGKLKTKLEPRKPVDSQEIKPIRTQNQNQNQKRTNSDEPLERMLLDLFLNHLQYLSQFKNEFPNYHFSDERVQQVVEALGVFGDSNQEVTLLLPKLFQRFSTDALKTFVSQLIMLEWNSPEDREQAFSDCLSKIKKRMKSEELTRLRNRISEAELRDDQKTVLTHMKAYQELLDQAHGV